MPLITYADKVQLNSNPGIPDNQKCTAKDMNEIKKAINDLIRPVGSYYETSDTSFDPNVTWGGTWELETDGTVLVSKSSESESAFNTTVGSIVGEEKHTLTIDEMPSHKHTMNAVRQWKSNGDHYWVSNQDINNAIENGTTSNTGGNQPHNNVQPSKIINRWHRTA